MDMNCFEPVRVISSLLRVGLVAANIFGWVVADGFGWFVVLVVTALGFSYVRAIK